MYPFYWTKVKGGIFMRYSFEYKKKCVELYRQGIWVETPDGFTDPRNFHSMIRKWNRIAENCGIEKLKHEKNKKWSQQEKNELILQILRGNSILEVASRAGINASMLNKWFNLYQKYGYDGLNYIPIGRPRKTLIMKKSLKNNTQLTEEEREEISRLKAEIERLKAENEVIKKSMALRHAEWDLQLKAKKQKSSKNSEKKDTN